MSTENEDQFVDHRATWDRVNALREAGLGAEALRLARAAQEAAQTGDWAFHWHIRIGSILWMECSRPGEAASEFRAACKIRPVDELANMAVFDTLVEVDVVMAYRHLAEYLERRGKNSPEANILIQGLLNDMYDCSVICSDDGHRIRIEGRQSPLIGYSDADLAAAGRNWPALDGVHMEFQFNDVYDMVWHHGGPVVWREPVSACELLNEGEKSEESHWRITFEGGAVLGFKCLSIGMAFVD